jgi:signal transduction histidine kinase
MMVKARYLHFPEKYRSLRTHAIAWIILPLALIVFGLVTAGILSYRRVVVQLLINHQSQLAVAAASNLSQVIDSYVIVLDTLASHIDIYDDATETQTALLKEATHLLEIFNAGVLLVDPSGNRLAEVSFQQSMVLSNLTQADFFSNARATRSPAISGGLVNQGSSQPIIIIATPIYDQNEGFRGALLGGIYLTDSRLTEPMRSMVIGEHRFAYLVDKDGQVIYHTFPEQNRDTQSDLPFIHMALSGEQGGMQWKNISGERFIIGYAPVASAGWGLVLEEPWAIVTSPARIYGYMLILAGLAAFITVMLLGWFGVRRIVTPIQALSNQARQLVTVDGIEPIAESGISEIDSLEHSFDQMAHQIALYRVGLRRYVGAITQKQEDESRHIARELHDETVQSLLAISRSLELEQASESDPERLKRLVEMQKLVSETLSGVRQISRDLRPLVLEDLGLIPALQALVRSAHLGPGAVPHVKLEVPGKPVRLHAQQELALYRITQEALTNARKHAQPTGVRVTLRVDNGSILLEIEDDGKGFQVPDSLSELAQRGCFGLMGIQERVWEMGGRLVLRSAPGEGALLQINMPVIPVS